MKPPKRHRKPPTRGSTTKQSTSKRRKITTEQQNIVGVQIGTIVTEVVAPRSERASEIDHEPFSSGISQHNAISGPHVITPGPALSTDARRQNEETVYQDVDMLGAGVSQRLMGLGIVQLAKRKCVPQV